MVQTNGGHYTLTGRGKALSALFSKRNCICVALPGWFSRWTKQARGAGTSPSSIPKALQAQAW